MVEPEPGGDLAQAPLRIDERVLHFLAGVAATDAALAGVASLVKASPAIDDDDLPLVTRIARLLSVDERARADRRAARSRAGRSRAPGLRAGRRCAQLSRPALWIEARDLPADPESLARARPRMSTARRC